VPTPGSDGGTLIPIWRKAATTSPEQSNVSGPALKNLYGTPTCAVAYDSRVCKELPRAAAVVAGGGVTPVGVGEEVAPDAAGAAKVVGIGLVAGGIRKVWPGRMTFVTSMLFALTSAPRLTP
jgi:hypothetical protein